MIKLLSKNALKKFARNPVNAIHKGTQKIKIQVAASALKGYSPFPQNLTFFMTYRCNLRCHVCGQWGDSGYVKNFTDSQLKDEVDINGLKSVIDDIAQYKPQITMCGGEVLLYKEWFEFMSYIKSKGLECILTTNGTLLEKNAEKIYDIKLDKISISLDGPEKIHDAARGVKNTFSKAMRGINAINRLKKNNSQAKPGLEIGCTISDQNYKHFDEIISIVESLNVNSLTFLHLAFLYDEEYDLHEKIFKNKFNTGSTQWAGYRYKPDGIDTELLIHEIERIKSKKYKMPIIFHPEFTGNEIKNYYQKPFFKSTSYKNICLAPWSTAYILPNGDVSPCSNFVAGNIRDQSLKNIWNNEKYKSFRNALKKHKTFPACVRCCELYKY